MSRRQQLVRMHLALAVLGAAAALVLSGCGAGQVAQTSEQVSAVNGASGDVGPIALRDAVLAYPGGSHPGGQHVFGYAEGQPAPLLVTIVNSGDEADELVSVTTPVAADVTVEGPTTIPNHSAVSSIEGGELHIMLTDLRQPVRPGLNTPVTFLFRKAGEVTLQVPIDTE